MIPARPKWRNPIAEHAKGLLKKELTHDLHRPLLRKVVPHGQAYHLHFCRDKQLCSWSAVNHFQSDYKEVGMVKSVIDGRRSREGELLNTLHFKVGHQ